MNKFILLLLLPTFQVAAQEVTADSLKKEMREIINDKFPSTRFFDVQYEEFTRSDYDTKLYDKSFEDGTIKRQQRVKMAFNVPIVKKERWVLSGSARYQYDSYHFENVTYKDIGRPGLYHDKQEEAHYWETSANFTYFSKLFNRPLMTNFSLIGDGSFKHGFERANASLMSTIVLKGTERTTVAVGFLVTTNNASLTPVWPVLVWTHQIQNSKWSLDAVIPSHMYFRRPMLKNGRLSLGFVVDNALLYTYPNQPAFNQAYSFNRNEIKTGFVYEYHLSKSLIMSLRGGAAVMFGGQMNEMGRTKEIMTMKQDVNGYFNIGLSFNPF